MVFVVRLASEKTAWIKLVDIASVRTDRRKRNSSQVERPRSKGRWNFSSDRKRGTDRSKSLMSCWLGRGELREILLFFFTATLARFDRENNRVCRATQLRESRECLFVRQRHDFSEEMRRAIGINSRIVIKILRILSEK